MVETKKYSFRGWSFRAWAQHNKNNLKDLVILLAGVNYFTGFKFETLIASLLVIVGKLAVDTLDYWLKEE